MAVSSVGAGAGVLTQDILDKLREADDAQYVTPLKLELADQDDRKNALKTIDASMTNLIDSINALKDVFELYGYSPLETPAFERYDILASKYAGGA
ncbi:MAG: hypothetical protein COB99_05320, partial [Sulfurimonas sp.]